MAILRVDSQTTSAQLENFLANATSKTRLRADIIGTDANGGAIYNLYTQNGKSDIFNKLTNITRDRNQNAADALAKIFDGYVTRERFPGKAQGSSNFRNAFQRHISDRTSFDGARALRGDAIKQLAKGINLINARLDPHRGGPDRAAANARLAGPDINAFNNEFKIDKRLIVLTASGALGRDTEAVKNGIKDGILSGLTAAGATELQRRELALSSGTHVKQAMRDEVKNYLKTHDVPLPDGFDELLDAGFELAASEILGTRQVGTTMLGNERMPLINIGGQEYSASKELGRGGFGVTHLYTNVNDPTDTLVFKQSLVPEDEEREKIAEVKSSFIKEILLHQHAQGGADNRNDGICGIEGAVRLENGMVGVVLETAPHGNIFELAIKTRIAISPSQPNPVSKADAELVKLTIIRDVLEGIQAMHSQGVAHLDFKGANCMLGGDAKAKIIDFGSAKIGNVRVSDLEVDNPAYLPPEVNMARIDASSQATNTSAQIANDLNPIVSEMISAAPEDLTNAQSEKSKLKRAIVFVVQQGAEQIIEPEILRNQAPAVGQAFDQWGVGTLALEMFTGDQFLRMVDTTDIGRQGAVGTWAKSATGGYADRVAVGGAPGPGVGQPDDNGGFTHLAASTGNPKFDDFVNKLLTPDPSKRMSIADALDHEIFKDNKDIGSSRIRELAVKISGLSMADSVRDL